MQKSIYLIYIVFASTFKVYLGRVSAESIKIRLCYFEIYINK